MHDEDVKLEDSIWYDAYKELVNYSKYFDISKKHTVFGDIYWGDVEFDEFKENIKERYIFLANNSLFLLAPLLLREGDFSTTLDNGAVLVQHNFSGNIYLKNDIYLSVLLEQYLFIDDYKKSILYKKINEYKEDSNYLENYKQGLLLLEGRILKENINDVNIRMFRLFNGVRSYLLGQKDTSNRSRKLCVLDEYFRIVRYTNDNKVWTSGYLLNQEDAQNNLSVDEADPFDLASVNVIPVLNRGIGKTRLIHSFDVRGIFRDNLFSINHLSEKDKQEIYLKLHDELPHDLEIPCILEETNLDCMIDERLKRPDDTKPCGVSFRIKEGNIFVNGSSFYHLCNGCGYIVKVPASLLSDGIKARIKERCSKDKNLFRKMELISELQALDDQSLPHHKVLFKSYKN